MSSKLTEMARDLRPVQSVDFLQWRNYYSSYGLFRKWPRHYLSPLRLCTSSIFWTITEDCLCLVKRRWVMGRPVMYLMLPPMHAAGDWCNENAALMEWAEVGVGARLSLEDTVRLHLRQNQLEPDKGNVEFIYEPLAGPRTKHERNRINRLARFERHEWAGAVPPFDAMQECIKVSKAWAAAKKRSFQSDMNACLTWRGLCTMTPWLNLTSLFTDGAVQPVAYTLGEQVGDKWAILTVGYHAPSYSQALGDAGVALHVHDCMEWYHHIGHDGLLNMGAAVGVRGLEAAKRKLRPVYEMQLYKLKLSVVLTAEDWKEARPSAMTIKAPPITITETGGYTQQGSLEL